MVMINLLPWRESKRLYQVNRIKKICLASFFLHIIFLCSWYVICAEIKQKITTRLLNLESQIKEFNVWKKSLQKLNDKNKAYIMNEELMRYRETVWQLLSLLEKNPNKKICFTQIKRNKNNYTFIGKAHSIIDLMLYLNDWNAAYLFSSITISSLEKETGAIRFRFVSRGKDFFSWSMLGFPLHDL